MKKVTILHCGGTISSFVDYKTGGVSSKYTDEDILRLYPEIKNLANINSKLIKNIASEDMDFKFYNLLAKEIEKEIKNNTNGIVITHGTDTLHYTSAALSFALENLPIPVILVGSQRSSDRGSSDATLNLISAFNFINKTDFKGVAICMHNSMEDSSCLILPATKTRKFHTSRRDAFKSINIKPIAKVENEKIDFINYHPEKISKELQLKLFKPNLKIGILKTHPNMSKEEIKNYSKFNGLIIEGSGLGHVPSYILLELKKLAKKIPVIMTSQCIFGRINMNVYSPGRKLIEAGILGNLADMTAETAFIKLAWLLSNRNKKEIPALINQDFRGEISKRTPTDFLEE